MNPPAPNVHIGRLDLDLRGVSAETAAAAVRGLAPALQAALVASETGGAPRDAFALRAGATHADLARVIATGLAARIHAGGTAPHANTVIDQP